MSYPSQLATLPNKQALVNEYKGKKKSELSTPCFIVNRSIVKENCEKMLINAKEINASFRAHVKTHKTLEGTTFQIGSGALKTDRIIVSTLAEAWYLLQLVEAGSIKDVLFSLPVVESKLGELADMTTKYPDLQLRVMLDNLEQLDLLSKFSKEHGYEKKWSVFVKVNLGTNRAGLTNDDPELTKIIEKIVDINDETDNYVSLYGFYCHAGHAYGARSMDQARSILVDEIDNANRACKKAVEINPSLKLVISAGSTPTSHASSTTADVLSEISKLGELHGELELHAGNYPFCDLQQVGTGCVPIERVACKVLADVVSAYPGRGDKSPGEHLINAGVIAMSRETGPIPGFGTVVSSKENGDWAIGRLSQEHGILIPQSDNCKLFSLSTRLEIVPQHSCITAANFPWYYVFDSDDEDAEVVDVWVPFRGW